MRQLLWSFTGSILIFLWSSQNIREFKVYYLWTTHPSLNRCQSCFFINVQKLYDTPGVHLHHRQAAVVHSEDLPALAPRSRLRGQCFPVCSLQSFHGDFLSASICLGFSFCYRIFKWPLMIVHWAELNLMDWMGFQYSGEVLWELILWRFDLIISFIWSSNWLWVNFVVLTY